MRTRARRVREFGPAGRSLLLVLAASCWLACASDEGEWRRRTFPPPLASRSSFPFVHDQAAPPKVVALRQQENLDGVVAGTDSELEVFEALTLWARRQFEPGIPDPYPLSNGLDILADIRSGKTGGFCGQYAYLLADALKSFGYYDVRYVELFSGGGDGHFLVEAWNNESGRWILLDPYYAVVPVDGDGTPLSSWDVRAAVAGRSSGAAHLKRLASAEEVSPVAESTYFQAFGLVAVSLSSNLSAADRPWTIAERRASFLAIRDEGNAEIRPGYYLQRSSRQADFLGARNVCQLELEWVGDSLLLTLDDLGSCGHLQGYQVRVDHGPWRDVPRESEVPAEFRALDCRTVNALGVGGVVTQLRRE